jgi:hypothetical protein
VVTRKQHGLASFGATFATAVLAALLAAGCATRTEVIIAVQSDIPNLDRITILVSSPSGASMSSMATFGTGPSDFVRTLGVTYSSGPTGPFLVTVTGFDTGTQIIARNAVFEFVRNETRVLHVDLLASCRGVACTAGQTCGESGCRAQMVSPSELEPYTGTVGSHDASGGFDGGGTGNDAAVVDDTGGGLMCGGNPCNPAHSTNPTCMGGRCTIGTCDTGFMDCDGRNSTGCETDTTMDRDNCGDCGMQCRGAMGMCCNGSCAATCP